MSLWRTDFKLTIDVNIDKVFIMVDAMCERHEKC